MKLKTLFFLLISNCVFAQKNIKNHIFTFSPQAVKTHEIWEGTCTLKKWAGKNPFSEVKLTGTFAHASGQVTGVTGFCDDQDGMIYKIRFLPTKPGVYAYDLMISADGKTENIAGNFEVKKSDNQGILRVDPENPWHFITDGNQKHFFWNSTTTYWMLGWKDDKIIDAAIDRLGKLKVNRIRVAINARAHGGTRWSEPNVVESSNFTFKLNPWLAKKPDDLDNPEFDVTCFNVAHWQKLDRLISRANANNIIVSLIFYVDGLDHGCDPFKKTNMGNAEEQAYYLYTAARYSAFPNITWDITNEYHLFRNEEWVEKMGKLLKAADPNKHLISVHGNANFPFRKSTWVDMVLYQNWDECGGYDFIANARKAQSESGRIIPQINEEYGYEDHYPEWGCGAKATKVDDGRSADNRRRLAWEMVMAGGYQTTGERANDGTGAGKDTGGGWINGRGNDDMTMLKGYAIMKDIFEKTAYWKMQPNNGIVNNGNYCLAQVDQEYLVYSRLPYCRLALPKNQSFSVMMINPRTGETTQLPTINTVDGSWQYPKTLSDDWAFIIKKI
ncbi:MAG: DUF4038 domain-containing protein [Leadbetterella sp.]